MTIETEWDEEAQVWVAEVLEVPGAIDSAETKDEAIRRALRVAAVAIEMFIDAGLPIPDGVVTIAA